MRTAIYPLVVAMGIGAAGIIGCDTSTPNSPAQQTAFHDEARATLERMEAQDSSLKNLIQNAYGYAIFPEVGAGAVGVGGASGEGTVYKNGMPIGTVKLTQASVGAQIGGTTYGELILFQDENSLNRLTSNSFEFGADANATAVKAGAAGAAAFVHGVEIYVLPKGGLIAGVSVNGQKFHFTPTNDQPNPNTAQ